MRKNEIIKSLLCTMLIGAMLFSANPLGVAADEWQDEQANGYEIMETSTETTTTTVDYGPAGIENGAVYAMQNVGTGLWASTRGSTDVTGISNVFQHTSWSSDYQTFTFEKTDTADNTYIIYTAETDTSGGKYALYCEYSTSAAANINVYPRVYNSSSAKSGFEWQIVQQDGYIHSIHLNADPAYKLYVRGTTAGSESNTAVSSVGNIIARKTTSTSIAEQQKWRLVYVLPEGEYYIKNRETSNFLHSSNNDVVTQGFLGNGAQKWRLDHYQNGKYQIYPSNAYNLVYLTSSQDGGDVSLSGNNMQPSSMWYIERLIDGTFKIESVWTEDLNVDYALQPAHISSMYVVNSSYTEGTNSLYEWFLIPTNGIYGMQTYRFNDDCLSFSNPSLAYALGLDSDDPDTFSMYLPDDDSQISKNEYNEQVDEDFLDWIEGNFSGVIDVEVEEDFSDNGANKQLLPNQFRVAMRTGVVDATDTASNNYGSYDSIVAEYHFWYQTYDGRWAHVRDENGNMSELFDKDITPLSTVGWAIADRYYKYYSGDNGVYFSGYYHDSYFFNSELRVYIITIE